MFNLEQSIVDWRQQMLAAGIKTPVPLEELEIHLREEVERQIKSGLNEQQAFASAVGKIGRPKMLRKEFQIINKPFMKNTLKHPSAFLPISMSLLAVAVVLTHIALLGTARQSDEGAAAHLWQLLMAAQMPIVAFFVVRWLPRAPRCALPVLALQIACATAAVAPVYFLHW